MKDEGNELYGLFRFVDKDDSCVAYFNPIGGTGIVEDGWKLDLEHH